jgi:hypothetical protein
MGRPKVHADAAAKHRAYRARREAETIRVSRKAWAALEARTNRVVEAVVVARQEGCPVAVQVVGTARDTLLDSLADWFEGQAKTQRATHGG